MAAASNIPLQPLEEWAQNQYGEHAPCAATLRRWAREGKIFPMPKKHGRAYFVAKRARYVKNMNDPAIAELMEDPDIARLISGTKTSQ